MVEAPRCDRAATGPAPDRVAEPLVVHSRPPVGVATHSHFVMRPLDVDTQQATTKREPLGSVATGSLDRVAWMV